MNAGGEATGGCGLYIATRAGGHFPCALGPNHEGDCMPSIEAIPRPRLPLPSVVEASESAFLAHMLNLLEAGLRSPIGPPLFTPDEALKLCRSLIWQRIGKQEFPF